jgi:uncharacterized phiE125 gp8 family phage protein
MQIIRDVTTTVEPVSEPITLAQAKNYLKVDFDDDNDLITSLIASARVRLEKYAGVAMSARTLQVVAYVDEFIELPYAPLNNITKVEYWDNGSWVEMSVGDYYILGTTYKKIYMVANNRMEYRFTYTCGYTTIPQPMITALYKLIADLYDYRESSVEDSKPNSNITSAYELIKPYKRISIFL